MLERRRRERAQGAFTCTLCHVVRPATDFPPSAIAKGGYHCRFCRAATKRAARLAAGGRPRAKVRAAAKEKLARERQARRGGVQVVEPTSPERIAQITAQKRERRHRDPAYREALNVKKRERYAAIGPGYVRDRDLVAERDAWRCAICGGDVTRDDWSLDHVRPLSLGGEHTLDNVVLAHKRCNSWRGQNRFDVLPDQVFLDAFGRVCVPGREPE